MINNPNPIDFSITANIIGSFDPKDFNKESAIPEEITVAFVEEQEFLMFLIGNWVISSLNTNALNSQTRQEIQGGCKICSCDYSNDQDENIECMMAMRIEDEKKSGETIEFDSYLLADDIEGYGLCEYCVVEAIGHVDRWVEENSDVLASQLL